MEKQSILIIDDSAFARNLLKKYLREGGYYNIIEASNGEEAIKKFKEKKPSLSLIDVILTEHFSGIDLLAKLKKLNPRMKAVMTTAIGQKEVIEKAKRLGAEGYLVKPLDEEDVLHIVNKLLKEKKIEDFLEGISRIGKKRFISVISKWLGEEVKIGVFSLEHQHMEEIFPNLKEDKIYFYSTIKNLGLVLLSIPKKDSLKLIDLLWKTELYSTKKLSEIALSTLREFCSMFSSFYLDLISLLLGKNFMLSHFPINIKGDEIKKIIKRLKECIFLKTVLIIAENEIKIDLFICSKEKIISFLS